MLARDHGDAVLYGRFRLMRLFRAVHGTSVFDYYRGLRMDRARALLERERISVIEAAYAAGYGNPANFATAFKRRFGLSPKDVRVRAGTSRGLR